MIEPSTTGPIPTKPLRGLSDIRRFFYRNETPIYFISATNFNLLGADEWVKGFKFICYMDCFDGQHPNVFVPGERPHDVFESIEDINNYLLEHKEVAGYVTRRWLCDQNLPDGSSSAPTNGLAGTTGLLGS